MRCLVIKLSLFFLFFSSVCFGQEENRKPFMSDRFFVTVGTYWPTDEYLIGVNGSFLENKIDLDEAFNIKNDHVTPLLSFYWRFSRKWRIHAEYFQLGYRRSLEIEEDINWGDYTFRAGTFVKGGIYLNMYRVAIGRTIYESDRFIAMAGIGMHALNIKAFIEGEAYVDDEKFSTDRYSVRGIAPLPNITLSSVYSFSKKFSGALRVDWFALKINEYSGSLWDVSPTLNFQAFDHLGFFLGYNFFDFYFKFDDNEWKGTFEALYKGPTIGITSNF